MTTRQRPKRKLNVVMPGQSRTFVMFALFMETEFPSENIASKV